MKNSDMPASPVMIDDWHGLTKREHFCLTMGVAETGDSELDDIILKGNKQKIAAMAMQGLSSACNANGEWSHDPSLAARTSEEYTEALLEELNK